jgi:hypothetical protein
VLAFTVDKVVESRCGESIRRREICKLSGSAFQRQPRAQQLEVNREAGQTLFPPSFSR